MPNLGAAYNLARWLMLNGPDAEDVVQEACLRARRSFPGYRGGDARAWLMSIVRNACFTWLRANRRFEPAGEMEDDLTPDESPGPEDLAMKQDSGARLRKALEKLPPDFREVIVLRELEEMSYNEIAGVTGTPLGTVMSRLSRARDRLRRALLELEEEATTTAHSAA